MKKLFTIAKRLFCVVTILFLSSINTAFAQTYNWVGGVDTNFYNPNNWSDTSVDFTADIQSKTFVVGAGNPNNPTNIGHSGADVIAKRPNYFNTITDANVIITGTLYPWNSNSFNGVVTLNGYANVNVRNTIYLGKGESGTLNLNSGSISSRYAFYIGNAANGNGIANVVGGKLYAGTYLEVGTDTGNPTGNVNISGGTVDVGTSVTIGTNGQINISGIGQLIVTGDKTTALQAYITSGKIACTAGKTLDVVFNGTRTTVSIHQDPNRMIQEFTDYIILKNGVLEAKINKGSSDIRSLKVNGVETLYQSSTNPRSGTYYDLTSSAGFEKIGNAAFSIKEETADYIDVSFSRPYTAGLTPTPVDVEIHYVLKKNDAGLYTYSILRHKATYPSFDLGSWRQVLWIDNTVTDKICVNDLKTWEMPQPTDAWSPTGIAEIIKIESGVRAGKYDGKYEFSESLIGLKAYGHSSDKNSLGIWAVTANHEYFNSGPTHHDLNAAAGIIHICMNGVHYNSRGFQVLQGEEWSKIYGPYLIYANQKTTATANWDDAKARAAKDEAEWPFSWLTNTAEYPLADGRGNITGKFSITDPAKPEVNGGDAWIGVTKLSPESDGNWQFEEENYQYWVKTNASGNFNIKNVRPGTYTLFAYKDGTTGEYRKETVVVTAAATTNIGNINWAIPRDNGKIVFEVGVPDRTAAEYKFGDFDYCEGFVQDKFAATFTNPVEYNVDDRNWKTALPYVQSAYFKSDGSTETWVWNVNFTLTGTIPTSGNAKLTIAYASSDHAQNWIEINGSRITPSPYYPPNGGGNAFLRQSNHAKYGLATFDVPYSKLKIGKNTMTLLMPSTSNGANHVMYDYISLEGNLTSTFNFIDTDKDGVEDAKDLCPNTPLGEEVNASGCSQSQLDDDNDGVKNNLDICPDTPGGQSVDAKGCILLPSNNFNIEAIGETCPNKNNGQIKISATASYNYVATINGNLYNLTNNNLTVTNLIPGTYDICINVAGKIAEQCYSVEIKAGTTVTGKSTIISNKTNVEIIEGTAPYKVMVNGKLLFTTMAKTFDVVNQPGDVIEVKTAVECEGVFSKTINSAEEIIAYPNPTKGLFEIAVPNSMENVTIELYTLQMQLISQKSYPVHYGKVQLSLENQAKGVYFAKVEAVNPVTLKIIKE